MDKRLFLMMFSCAMIIAGCRVKSIGEQIVMLDAEIDGIYEDSKLTDEQKNEKACSVLTLVYDAHREDSLGLYAFKALISSLWDAEKGLQEYEKSSGLIRENELVRTKAESIRNIESSSPGKSYKEITGIDAVSGDELSLSSFIGGEKPILIDFWASWCGPCRREIKENLLALAQSEKAVIVGVAVWEKDIADTQSAMEELGITWPVIYTGGRVGSPTIIYGVRGIPALVLLSPDGTILSRGHSMEEIEKTL